MNDNYYKIIDLIENCSNKKDIDNQKLNELVSQTSAYNKTEIVVYCNVNLRKIKDQLFLNNCKFFGLALLLLIISSRILNQYFDNEISGIIILYSIILLFLFKPGNYMLAVKRSRYKRFRAKFSAS